MNVGTDDQRKAMFASMFAQAGKNPRQSPGQRQVASRYSARKGVTVGYKPPGTTTIVSTPTPAPSAIISIPTPSIVSAPVVSSASVPRVETPKRTIVYEGKVIEAPQLMTPEFKREQARKIQEVLAGKADPSTIGVDRIITKVTSSGPGVGGMSMVGKIVGLGQAGKGYYTAPKTQITGGGLLDTEVTDTGVSTEGWFTPETAEEFFVGKAAVPEVDWEDIWKQKRFELLRGSAETLAQTGMLPKTVQFPHRLVEIAEQYKVKPEDIFTSEPGIYRPAGVVSPKELSAAYSQAIGGGTMAGYLASHPEIGGRVDVRDIIKEVQKSDLLPLYPYQSLGARQAMRGIWPELIPYAQQTEAVIKKSVTPFKAGGKTPFPTAGGAAAAEEAGYFTWPYPQTIAGGQSPSLPQLPDDVSIPLTSGRTRYITAAGSGGMISPWMLGAAGGGLLLAGAGRKENEERQ